MSYPHPLPSLCALPALSRTVRLNSKQRILSASAALLLALVAPLHGVTETWDGGGADNNVGTAANWLDNTAPLSDLVNTDLIFGGITRLSPNFNGNLEADSLTFNNTAGAFSMTGSILTIGAGGITNNDTNTQTFGNQVHLGANFTSNAAAGALHYGVVAPSGFSLTLTGAQNTSIVSFSGSGSLIKNGTGTLTIDTFVGANQIYTVNSGTVNLAGGGTFQTVQATCVLDINGGSFLSDKDLTVSGSGVLTLDGGTLGFSAGRKLILSGGGTFAIGVAHTVSAGAKLVITETGSKVEDGVGGSGTKLTLATGAALEIMAGGSFDRAGGIDLGSGGQGTISVIGAGSSLDAGPSVWGSSGGTATVLFDNGATGQIASIILANSPAAGTTATFSVLGGSKVTVSTLSIGASSGAGSGATVTVSGVGSEVNAIGNTSTLGSSTDATGTLKVLAGGLFRTGGLSLGPLGSVEVSGGGSRFSAEGNLSVNAGEISILAGGAFDISNGKTLTLSNGASISFTGGNHGFEQGANFVITGGNSAFSGTGAVFTFAGGASVSVAAGGSLTTDSSAHFGIGTGAAMTVSGANSSFSTGLGSLSRWGGNGGAATVTFSNAAVATLGAVELGGDTSLGTAGTLTIQSGAQSNARSMDIGIFGGASQGTVSIDGAGSKLTVSGPTGLTLGAANGLPSTLILQNGGTLAIPSGETRIRATGTLTVTGGTLQVARLTLDGGTASIGVLDAFQSPGGSEVKLINGGKIDFAAGFLSLNPVAFQAIGEGSAITSPTKVHLLAGSSLSAEGGADVKANAIDLGSVFGPGSMSADGIGTTINGTGGASQWGINSGSASVSFSGGAAGYFDAVSMPSSPSPTSSTLSIAGGADVTMTSASIATGSTLGAIGIASVDGPGSTFKLTSESGGLTLGGTTGTVGRLTVSNSAVFSAVAGKVNPTGILTVDGGFAIFTGFYTNAGTIDHRAGSLTMTGLQPIINLPTGTILVGDTLTLGIALVNQAGGRLTLTGANGVIAGSGSVQNSGLLHGSGTVEAPIQNLSSGEIRVENGKSLLISTLNGANAGKIQLQGGSLEFVAPVTNGATGQISGRGAVHFGGGLTNLGAIQLSGGFSDISGNVSQSGAAAIIVSGGATGTFYDDITHNGAEFRTSAGARSVFFGAVNGAGPFTGTGETFFEGGYLPGNSPSVVMLSTNVTFTASNTLTMEIGGLTPGPGTPADNGCDKLIFTNAGTPMLTWGGTLAIDLINGFSPQPGQVFDLFDFDPARDAGTFSAIQVLDPLPAGTAFDFSQLYTTGEVLVVVPEPAAAALLLLGGMAAIPRRRRA